MPRYNQMRYNQKWSLFNTWSTTVDRHIRVAVITAQYRLVSIVTAQHRLLSVITSQYRSIKLRIGG